MQTKLTANLKCTKIRIFALLQLCVLYDNAYAADYAQKQNFSNQDHANLSFFIVQLTLQLLIVHSLECTNGHMYTRPCFCIITMKK